MDTYENYGNSSDARRKCPDCEISAADVAREEIFPRRNHKHVASPSEPADLAYKGSTESENRTAVTAAEKPVEYRTRPTNHEYEMIDPDGDTADTAKS